MSKEHFDSIQQTATKELVQLAIKLSKLIDMLPDETDQQYEVKDAKEHEYWNIVATLHKRGTDEEYIAAKNLATSDDEHERVLAANILGQLCWQDTDKYHDKAVLQLITLLDDKHVDVVYSAAYALGHRTSSSTDYRAVQKLVGLSTHTNVEVRRGVVSGLSGLDNEAAISALISLMNDKDDDVRDWATFGLGSQIATDTDEIRRALKAKLNDTNLCVRGEALVGLAERKDENALKFVKKSLREETKGTYGVNAARIFAHSSLLPDLLAIKNASDDYNDYFLSELDEAIEACSSEKTV